MRAGRYSDVADIVASDEFNDRRNDGLVTGDLAVRLYRELLRRGGSEEELANAAREINAGRAAQLAHSILVSSEFQASVNGEGPLPPPGPGPGPTEPVPAQRPALERRSAAMSPEAADRMVRRMYKAVLGREVDDSGLGAYTSLVARGEVHRVVNALVLSPELEGRRPSLDAVELATTLYREILDREPDPGGLEATREAIVTGGLADRTAAMLLSEEYRLKD